MRKMNAWYRKRGHGEAITRTPTPKKGGGARKGRAEHRSQAISKTARKALHARFRRRLAQFAEKEALTADESPDRSQSDSEARSPSAGAPDARTSGAATWAAGGGGMDCETSPSPVTRLRSGSGVGAFLDALTQPENDEAAQRLRADRIARAVFTGLFGCQTGRAAFAAAASSAAASAAAASTFGASAVASGTPPSPARAPGGSPLLSVGAGMPGALPGGGCLEGGALGSMLDEDVPLSLSPTVEQAIRDILRSTFQRAVRAEPPPPPGALFQPWHTYVTPRVVHSLLHALPLEGPMPVSPRLTLLRALYATLPSLQDSMATAFCEACVAIAAQGAAVCAEAETEAAPAGVHMPAGRVPPQALLSKLLDLMGFLLHRAGREVQQAMEAQDAARMQALQRRAQGLARVVGTFAMKSDIFVTLCSRVTACAVALVKLCPPTSALILHQLLSRWPRMDGGHQAALLSLVGEMLAVTHLPLLVHGAPRTLTMLCGRLKACAVSSNAQVARRALDVLSNVQLTASLFCTSPELLKALTGSIHEVSKAHWDAGVRESADRLFDELLDVV